MQRVAVFVSMGLGLLNVSAQSLESAAWAAGSQLKARGELRALSGSEVKSGTPVEWTFETETQKPDSGPRTSKVVYRSADGKPALEEEVQYGEDPRESVFRERIQQYVYHQVQVNERIRVWIDDGRLKFELHGPKGIAEDSEKWKPNTLIFDQIYRFVMNHWKELLDDETFGVRLIVPERLETVGFRLSMHKETVQDGVPCIVFKMKPSSPFISFLTDPVFFTFEKETHRLKEVSGHMPVKRWTGSKWGAVEAQLKITSLQESPLPSGP